MTDLLLNVNNVSFRYEQRIVLDEVSLQLRRGEMLGLVGPNGSGKSTLLKVMLGLLPLQAGQVEWFGTPLAMFRQWSRIGYVSQKSNSFNTGFPATVEEVVAMGLTGKLGLFRSIGKAERQLIRTAIDTVGLDTYYKQNIGALSGGQQQRVFIARALVSDPEVLILDEPTVGVDSQNELFFYDLLQTLNADRGLSIVLVSHDMGVVSKRMHSIACLNQRLFFHGNAAQFEHDREHILQQAYGKEMHILHHDH